MSRRIAALFCLGFATLWAAAPVRADEPAKPLPPEQVFRWAVRYLDSTLGFVWGNATVDWKKSRAVVVLTHPLTGQKFTLKSKSVQSPSQGGGIATIVLEGYSPDNPVTAPPLDGMRNLGAATGTKTKIRDEAAQIKARVQSPRHADDGTVTIELAADGNGMLQGRWSYIADPRTERDRNGRGRAGTFDPIDDPDAFLGRESGVEVWEPLPPEFDYVQVVENQLETFQLHNGNLVPSYPYHGDNSIPGHVVNPGVRTLMVVGRNFPIFPDPYPDLAGRALVEPTGDWNAGSSVSQGYHEGVPVNAFESENAAEARALGLIKQGWKRLGQRLRAPALAEVRDRDPEVALIRVGLPFGSQPVIPRIQTLNWGGVQAPWFLQFGDNASRLDFVRPLQVGLEIRWEAISLIYAPEKIALELHTQLQLPLANIPIRLSLGGRETIVTAARLDARSPTAVYRTPLMTLAPPGGPDTGFRVDPGDLLQALVDTPLVVFNEGPITGASVNVSSGSQTEWEIALRKAAAADGVDNAGLDSGTLAAKEAVNFRHFSMLDVTGSQGDAIVKTSFQVGDHAAMLLLRDEFVRTMRTQVNGLKSLLRPGDQTNDDKILGWANTARAQIEQYPGSLWGTLAAGTSKAGLPVTLAQALDRPAVEADCGGDLEEADKWQLQAARLALADYVQRLETSQAKAEEVKDGDFAKLLELTNRGFDALSVRMQAKLMRFDARSGLWVPDDVARTFVQQIGGKYDTLLARQKLGSIQREFVMNLITAVMPVAGSYSALTRVLVAAGNGLIWEINSAAEIYQTYEAKQEVRFAFGAQGVLGDARLEEAIRNDRSWWTTAASITGQGVLAAFESYAALKDYDAVLAQRRGRAAYTAIKDDLGAIRQIPANQRTDLLAFLEVANGLQQEGGILDELEQQAMDQWKRMSKNAWLFQDAAELKRIDGLRQDVQAAERELNPRIGALEKDAATAANKAKEAKETLEKSKLGSAEQELQRLGALEKNAATAAKEAEEALENMKTRLALCGEVRAALGRESEGILITEAGAPVLPVQLSRTDLDWLSGRIKRPSLDRVKALLSESGNRWESIKAGFKKGTVSAADMHQFVTYRKEKMTVLLTEAKLQVAQEFFYETGILPELSFKALGSKNLTSDLDFSVIGEGAERVAIRFNKLFREDTSLGFSGLESGYVFDTNVYTDPVYRLYKNSTLTGRTFNLANADLDGVRQFVYQSMAAVKYGGARRWAAEKAMLRGAAPADAQKMLTHIFEEAEAAEEAGLRNVAYQAGTAPGELHALKGTNQLMRSQTLAYEKTLDNISQWRREYSRLDELLTTGRSELPKNAAFLGDYPGWDKDLKHLEELYKTEGKTAAKVKTDAELARNLGKVWRERIVYQLRKKQGEALYYASEAYQTEATIFHVVDDIQEARDNKINIEKLLGAPLLSKVSPAGSLTSIMENRANLFKELSHVVNPATGLPDKPAESVAGCIKYFIRMVDAAHQSGANLTALFDEKFIRATVMLNNRRGNLADMKLVFNEVYHNSDALAYFTAMQDASDTLARYAVQQSDFGRLAKRITPLLDDVVLAKTAAKRSVDGFEKIP